MKSNQLLKKSKFGDGLTLKILLHCKVRYFSFLLFTISLINQQIWKHLIRFQLVNCTTVPRESHSSRCTCVNMQWIWKIPPTSHSKKTADVSQPRNNNDPFGKRYVKTAQRRCISEWGLCLLLHDQKLTCSEIVRIRESNFKSSQREYRNVCYSLLQVCSSWTGV